MLLKNVKWSDGYYARSKELYFTCIDINKDGVKELILYYMDSPHAYGWNRIYTYTGGRVKSLGQFTSVSICTNKKYFHKIQHSFPIKNLSRLCLSFIPCFALACFCNKRNIQLNCIFHFLLKNPGCSVSFIFRSFYYKLIVYL